jgi:hypothetical protein
LTISPKPFLSNVLTSLPSAEIRDIVDTTLFEGKTDAAYLLKALLGGINRSIDKQG